MALSRSARITVLLVIDVVFFFIELVVGYTVGSLALIADSFHMLNDVMSLVVALYAIKLTAQSATDSRYTYGWHRAEILAALINGVFLLALCFSISLEALQRFFTTPEISNPKLVVIVGSFGLASNIVGLFLFHEHGHSHGHSHGSASSSRPSSVASSSIIENEATPTQKIPARRHSRSDSLYGHPAATRASLVKTANELASARSPSPTRTHIRSHSLRPSVSNGRPAHDISEEHEDDGVAHGALDSGEDTPLLHESNHKAHDHAGHTHSPTRSQSPASSSHSHDHGHSHAGSMNMRALVLHVLGDALGNVGVIATGLIIWLTTWSYKYYCDPVISLVITVIIFSSALPLVRSASFILLQGVPPTISIDEVRRSILDVDGVLSLHELHVWQLSETKIVASVHVTASRSHDFMPVAVKIRKALHHHGIHSSTIQPEYHNPGHSPLAGSFKGSDTSCLILCPPDQACDPQENSCCPPPSTYV
jgi:zinc transporter 1